MKAIERMKKGVRPLSDKEKDERGRAALSSELPDVRGEDRVWSDAALDDLAGRFAGDPGDADKGMMDVDLSPEELRKRLMMLSPGSTTAMRRMV